MRKRQASVENSSEYWLPKGKAPARHMGGSEFWESEEEHCKTNRRKHHLASPAPTVKWGFILLPLPLHPTLNCSSS